MVKAPRPDSGYVLLAVLWLSVGIGGLALLISSGARVAMGTSRNRVALSVATWSAAACLAHARMALTDALEDEAARRAEAFSRAWDRADRVLTSTPPPDELACELAARPVGSRLDVNATDPVTLARVFRQTGMAAGSADSLAATIALRKPYVDIRQLHAIEGYNAHRALDSVLDVQPGSFSLNHASGPILALLPGFTEAVVDRVLARRAQGVPISAFSDLEHLISPDDSGALARLAGLALLQPQAWVITVRARAGRPSVTVVMEQRMARARKRTWVAGRRSWIE